MVNYNIIKFPCYCHLMLLLDDFFLSQKMSCHSQRAVCLSQRPENAGSYAAPRTQQSLSLWKAAQMRVFS